MRTKRLMTCLALLLGDQISMPWDDTVTLTQKLLGQDGVQPAGLGARDSLRLEAGLCLYGHDLGPDTSPVEAALLWTIRTWRFGVTGCWGTVVSLLYVREKVHCAMSASLRRMRCVIVVVRAAAKARREAGGFVGAAAIQKQVQIHAITAPCSSSSSKSLSHTHSQTPPDQGRRFSQACWLAGEGRSITWYDGM